MGLPFAAPLGRSELPSRMRNHSERSPTAWDRAKSEQLRIKLEAILAEAAILFAHRGYNSTSLDDIAKRLNITKTALYHYVQNKNQLLYLCYERSVELTHECYERADRENQSGLQKILAYLRLDASRGVMSMTPLNEIEAIEDPKQRQRLQQHTGAFEARFRGFIELGIRDGSIKPCDPGVTALFILGASRYMMHWYNPDAGHDLQTIVEQFIQFCCQGIESGGPEETAL
jgi:TetR/AcrR family transcriptional regulator, cholesterol catabolism regulator